MQIICIIITWSWYAHDMNMICTWDAFEHFQFSLVLDRLKLKNFCSKRQISARLPGRGGRAYQISWSGEDPKFEYLNWNVTTSEKHENKLTTAQFDNKPGTEYFPIDRSETRNPQPKHNKYSWRFWDYYWLFKCLIYQSLW